MHMNNEKQVHVYGFEMENIKEETTSETYV
jgi:hypothetical protein